MSIVARASKARRGTGQGLALAQGEQARPAPRNQTCAHATSGAVRRDDEIGALELGRLDQPRPDP
ncbi:MAG: hypothetical protein WCP95_09540 [Actinomycetes bacterium]